MLVLNRNEGESWKDAALRVAKQYGLYDEVHEQYHKFIHKGYSEDDAAFYACEEWDILEYEPNENNEGESNGR